MGQVLHGSATTTEAVRRAIQHSQESLRALAKRHGVNPKTIVSKFYRVPVQVPPGQTSVPYTQVEQDLTFPMPPPAVLDAYVVYVGFDPNSAPAKPERKPAKQKKRQ